MLNIRLNFLSLRWARAAVRAAVVGGGVSVCISVAAQANPPIAINEIRMRDAPEHLRFVFEMNQPPRYHSFVLRKPYRLVLDMDDARLQTKFPTDAHKSALLRRIITGTTRKTTTRVVFELKRPVRHRIHRLAPNGAYQHRLLVDFLQARAATTPPAPPPARSSNAKILVLIDPGHGGEDPGALGRRAHEKKVVLQIAREIKRRVDQQPGLRAELTRRGDYYVSLRRRLALARNRQADLFISIHADAFHDSAARGASVYALSRRGASSETAKWLADKENASDLIGGVRLANKEDDVAGVLLSMSMDKTVNDSVNFGRAVLGELEKIGRVHSERVEQAGFAVLKSPDIPSILIETAYITNPAEEKLLRSARHQRRIATAVVAGVRRYLHNNRNRYAYR